MITKGSIVQMALAKLLGDECYSDSLEGQGNIKRGLENLEAMMAQWQVDGFDICYNFSTEDVTPLATEDSFLLLWMKLPVACNLAILLATDFGLVPDQSLAAEARNGMRTIIRTFSRNDRPVKKPRGILPLGEGNIRTGVRVNRPDEGFKK